MIQVTPRPTPNISVTTGGAAYRPTFDAIVTTETAGADLQALRAVVFDGDDNVVYASASNRTHAGRVAGMTLEAAAEGEPVRVVRYGILNAEAVDAVWGDSEDWEDNDIWNDQDSSATFLGEGGTLTRETPAVGGFLQQLIFWQSSSSFLFSATEQVIYIDA
ncbi:hypothetical protein VB780_03575 [Leptolyngbya sp. CCNP1308]|uniref:hypothetical protein n=1 Tax=Leptolyngbya sp. CCNP1308 TaxID=3110255 RepID=UPI002B210021|nr:hypothetical protein [Leptolyngbya sp. CCNP1308]MEA5447635.1 hypothetical protein [Leptolyngbya sp. CCNP1308]